MEFDDVILGRRSIRGYKPDPVPVDVLERVLEAGRMAPTAANYQPIHFIVVTDSVTRTGMKAVYDREWFYEAPVILVGCVEPAQAWKRFDGWNAAEVDIAIAFHQMILAATAEGLGTCWVCHFDEAALKRLLGIPEGVRAIALTPMGFPAALPRPFARKDMAQILHKERW